MTKRNHEKSGGNVFADLGVSAPDQAPAKAELARQIARVVESRRLTQVEAATVLGLDQPKVSALLRGHLSGFSTERLFRCLNALGRDVQIIIKPARPRASARVSVRAARSGVG